MIKNLRKTGFKQKVHKSLIKLLMDSFYIYISLKTIKLFKKKPFF